VQAFLKDLDENVTNVEDRVISTLRTNHPLQISNDTPRNNSTVENTSNESVETSTNTQVNHPTHFPLSDAQTSSTRVSTGLIGMAHPAIRTATGTYTRDLQTTVQLHTPRDSQSTVQTSHDSQTTVQTPHDSQTTVQSLTPHASQPTVQTPRDSQTTVQVPLPRDSQTPVQVPLPRDSQTTVQVPLPRVFQSVQVPLPRDFQSVQVLAPRAPQTPVQVPLPRDFQSVLTPRDNNIPTQKQKFIQPQFKVYQYPITDPIQVSLCTK